MIILADVLMRNSKSTPRWRWAILHFGVWTLVGLIFATISYAATFTEGSRRLSFADAIVVESLAYSMLLAGGGFRAWRTATPARVKPESAGPRVRLAREGDLLVVTLSRPEARNAVDARMRDALVEALEFALVDPEVALVELRGEGPAFCAGEPSSTRSTRAPVSVRRRFWAAISESRLVWSMPK